MKVDAETMTSDFREVLHGHDAFLRDAVDVDFGRIYLAKAPLLRYAGIEELVRIVSHDVRSDSVDLDDGASHDNDELAPQNRRTGMLGTVDRRQITPSRAAFILNVNCHFCKYDAV